MFRSLPAKLVFFRQGPKREVIFSVETAGYVEGPLDVVAKCPLKVIYTLQCELRINLRDFAIPRAECQVCTKQHTEKWCKMINTHIIYKVSWRSSCVPTSSLAKLWRPKEAHK